jgi:MFS family permease
MSARRAAWIAWPLSGLSAFVGGLYLLFLALSAATTGATADPYWGAGVVVAVVFPAVGALIVSRYPHNALGWVFCALGLSWAIGGAANAYAAYALFAESGSLPGGELAAWVGTWMGNASFLSIVFVPLLFPDGRPPSRRWRPLVWLAVGVIGLVAISEAFMPGPMGSDPPVDNPFGLEGAGAVLGSLSRALELILNLVWLAGIASLVWRYLRSRGRERQQLKWFTYAVAVVAPLSLVGNGLFPDLAWLIGGICVASIPVAIGVAVLSHRLYEIDIVINRTLVYGSLTAALVGFYFGGIVILQRLFIALTGEKSTLAVVGSTLVIAALFNPLRRRIQAFIDRLFYRKKYDAAKTLEAFSARLREETDLDALADELVGVVGETVQPAHVSLWLRPERAAPQHAQED